MDLTVRRADFGNEDQTWLGSAHGTDAARSVTLDMASFTEATHFPDGHLPSGLPLARLTGSDTYVPYDSAAAGTGAEVLRGFLLGSISAGDGTTNVQGAMIDHGRVIVANLPVAFTLPADSGLFTFVE